MHHPFSFQLHFQSTEEETAVSIKKNQDIIFYDVDSPGAPSVRCATGPGAWPHLLYAVSREINKYLHNHVINHVVNIS